MHGHFVPFTTITHTQVGRGGGGVPPTEEEEESDSFLMLHWAHHVGYGALGPMGARDWRRGALLAGGRGAKAAPRRRK